MIGMAAGMAQRGMRVFCYTIATFALYRPFEFIRNDLAYQNLPVTVVGIGGGLTYSTLGATHHAMEDIAVACAIPNMRVIAPCDPLEVEAATRWCAQNNEGPIYMRLGKAGEPSYEGVDASSVLWNFNQTRFLRMGQDHCIITYGPSGVKRAKYYAKYFEERGEEVSIVLVSTLKPLDTDGIRYALLNHPKITVIEEMVQHGGLGDKVRAISSKMSNAPLISTVFLRDEFSHIYGAHDDLIAEQLQNDLERYVD
jgi:transketolase